MRLPILALLCLSVGCTQTVYIRPIEFETHSPAAYLPQEADLYEGLFLAHANIGYSALGPDRKPHRIHQGLYFTTFASVGGILTNASFDEIQGDKIWRIETRVIPGQDDTYLFTFWVWEGHAYKELPHAQKTMTAYDLVLFSVKLKNKCMDTPPHHQLQEINEDF